MEMTFRRADLRLRHTFRIARGAEDTASVVFVELHHDGITGIGEAAPSRRYGETCETVETFLRSIDWSLVRDPFRIEAVMEVLDAISPGNGAAKAAVDIALHDWMGKRLGVPLHRLWGLDPAKTPLTSFTIGIDTPDVLAKKIAEAGEYPILKIKLGTEDDAAIMAAVRSATKRMVRVDANEGWRTKEEAYEKIKWLEGLGVEFVEQPMPASDLESLRWLKERVRLPLIADESCLRARDIPALRDSFHGINIKLMKCGGLREAIRMIHTARACDMKIMCGCMIESSTAIGAAAQFSSLLDYADLDGNLLITNDPYTGTAVQNGKLILNNKSGIGVTPRPAQARD